MQRVKQEVGPSASRRDVFKEASCAVKALAAAKTFEPFLTIRPIGNSCDSRGSRRRKSQKLLKYRIYDYFVETHLVISKLTLIKCAGFWARSAEKWNISEIWELGRKRELVAIELSVQHGNASQRRRRGIHAKRLDVKNWTVFSFSIPKGLPPRGFFWSVFPTVCAISMRNRLHLQRNCRF